MNHSSWSTHAAHRDLAQEAKAHPGRWITLHPYSSRSAALMKRADIEAGRAAAFRPASDWEVKADGNVVKICYRGSTA